MSGNAVITGGLRAVAKASSAASPAIAGRLLARLFTTPARHRMPPREATWMRGARGHRLPFDGKLLPIYEFGAGPTVLLVHGWSGRGGQLGAYVGPLVDAGFRVVTYDAPAHGTAEGRTASLPEMARAVERVADAIGPVEAIVAHSLGAAATTMAVARGLAVGRLVYLAPPAGPGKYLARAGAFLGFSAPAIARAQRLLERRFDVLFDDASVTALAPALSTPLLIVHDEDDAEVPHADGRAIAAAWPGARLVSTRGLGHRRIIRDDAVVRAGVQFVSGAAVDELWRSQGKPAAISATPPRRSPARRAHGHRRARTGA